MSADKGRRWTLIVVREGEASSHTLELSRLRLVVLGAFAFGLIGGLFFLVGQWSGRSAAGSRITALQQEASDLQQANRELGAVADRVELLESQYRQLRGVMAGDVAESQREILLPLQSREPSSRLEEMEGEREFLWPLVERGFLTRSFGDTTAVPFGGHVGVDIAVPAGSYVRSARVGRVREAGEHPEYGKYVRLEHDGNIGTLYAHNSWLFVEAGDSVETGEVIALSGNSGRSTAPHLHLEFDVEGEPVDPLGYLSGGG